MLTSHHNICCPNRRSITLFLLLFGGVPDAAISFQPYKVARGFKIRAFNLQDNSCCSSLFAGSTGGLDPNDGQGSNEREKKEKTDIPDFNLLDRSYPDSERRPSRLISKKKREKDRPELSSSIPSYSKYATLESKFKEWGVETIDDPSQQPKCPYTINSVAQAAFHAISSTLYHKNRLDPNIANNALAVSVTDKRPLAFAYWPEGRDVGRLGIEVDGARFLSHKEEGMGEIHSHDNEFCALSPLTEHQLKPRSMKKRSQHEIEMEGRALRRLSLVLAAKLSTSPWEGLEHNHNDLGSEFDSRGKKTRPKSLLLDKRPVALFFNTIRQALLASQDLQLLQQIAKNFNEDLQYDNVRILCLGQDEIPQDMIEAETTAEKNGQSRKKWVSASKLSKGTVNPHRGLVLVVQPTDFNNEAKPPSPSIGTVHHLQRLLARASIAQLPAVVISPRLTEQLNGSGIEQSGYQQSSTYGGVEPPKGPTPWILRDFATPVFSWIGDALEISRRPSPGKVDPRKGDVDVKYLTRVAITQSVMDSGHPWHFFTVEESLRWSESKYQYIASTGTRTGRPSKQIISDVISEWC